LSSIEERLQIDAFILVTGHCSSYFTVEIIHGGCFVGTGSRRSYVSGHSVWYDNVDSVTWSPLMIENLVEDMGYEMAGRITVHYCVPHLSIGRNGLREISSEADTQTMVEFVASGNHFLKLYLDHDDSLKARDREAMRNREVDMLSSQDSQFIDEDAHVSEEVLVTMKNNQETTDSVTDRSRKRKNLASVTERDEGDVGNDTDDDEDLDFDPKDIVDSEFDISDADDDLFEDNVDNWDDEVKIPKGHGKEKAKAVKLQARDVICKEEEDEEHDLWAPEEDNSDMLPPRFKTFRAEDMHNLVFHVGLCFESVEVLRKEIQAYSCINRQDIKLPVNDKRRLNAKCSAGCSWNLWASYSSISKCFMIKKYCGEHSHSCSRTFKVHAFTSNFLAERYLESFRADQDMNMKNFSRII
jgi:hypothetical protein